MKKLFTLFFMALATTCMFAGWQPSDNAKIRLDQVGVSGQIQLKALRTLEGKTVMTWLRWTQGADEASTGYYLYMQVLDVDGTPLLGDGGVVVDGHQTASYTTDYGLALAQNGDIIMTYTDTRTSDEDEEISTLYVYRYNQQGQPVWSADGIQLTAVSENPNGYDMEPLVCVSGENIYVGLYHTEGRKDNFQLLRFNNDGTLAWSANKVFGAMIAVMKPCVDGDLYLIYDNAAKGLDAQRINKDGENVWGEPVTIEEEALSSGRYIPAPECTPDGNGGLAITYRKLQNWSGYQVVNHLSADGTVLSKAVSCNGSTGGDAGNAVIGARGDKVLVAWQYRDAVYQLNVNLLSADGSYAWQGAKEYGIAYGCNEQWGFHPVAIIPLANAWVVIYNDLTSWNGGNLMVSKINDAGETLWSKQIAEENLSVKSIVVTSDDKNAYIFYSQEAQDNDDSTGGMFAMCVDISKEATDIQSVKDNERGTKGTAYDLQGRRLSNPHGLYIERSADGSSRKVLLNR